MSIKQIKRPECSGYKIDSFYTVQQGFLYFLALFTFDLIKPEKLQMKCKLCGYVFEIPYTRPPAFYCSIFAPLNPMRASLK